MLSEEELELLSVTSNAASVSIVELSTLGWWLIAFIWIALYPFERFDKSKIYWLFANGKTWYLVSCPSKVTALKLTYLGSIGWLPSDLTVNLITINFWLVLYFLESIEIVALLFLPKDKPVPIGVSWNLLFDGTNLVPISNPIIDVTNTPKIINLRWRAWSIYHSWCFFRNSCHLLLNDLNFWIISSIIDYPLLTSKQGWYINSLFAPYLFLRIGIHQIHLHFQLLVVDHF